MKVNLFWRVLPVHICVFVLLVLPIWQRHMDIVHAQQSIDNIVQNSAKTDTLSYEEGIPARIVIARLGIDLKVVTGSYIDNTSAWTVATDSANYAVNTAKTNNKRDTTLIYGHATSKVFAQTKDLKKGDKVIVKTDNNHVFIYSFKSYEVLNPTDTYLFKKLDTKDPGLALMTCTGLLSQERRVMYFNLEQAK